jgi:hypothetical protein
MPRSGSADAPRARPRMWLEMRERIEKILDQAYAANI